MNIHRIDDAISVTGQITVDDLTRIKELGFKSLLCARPDAEEPGQPDAADIAREAQALGMTLIHIPVRGRPTDRETAALQQERHKLAKPVLGYCKSGMRASVLWSLLESTQ